MTFADGRTRQLATCERTSVITSAVLLARRVQELQRRRQALVDRQEQVRAQLPDWAVQPLQLVGLTKQEIGSLVDELSTAESASGLDQIEQELDDLDSQIDELERLLVSTPSSSLEDIDAVLRLTVRRFHDVMVTDPSDVFYDHGEARLVALIERVQHDLSALTQRSRPDAM